MSHLLTTILMFGALCIAGERDVNLRFAREFDSDILFKTESYKKLSQIVESYKHSNPHAKLTMCWLILQRFDDLGPGKKLRDLPKSISRDLTDLRERAVWVFEQVTDLQLPPVLVAGYYDIPASKQVRRAVEEYCLKIIKSGEVTSQKFDLLKQKYPPLISPGLIQPKLQEPEPEIGDRALRTFDELLKEWCPIGKTLTDLETLMGKPAVVDGDMTMFAFASSEGSVLLRIVTSDGKITAIYQIPQY